MILTETWELHKANPVVTLSSDDKPLIPCPFLRVVSLDPTRVARPEAGRDGPGRKIDGPGRAATPPGRAGPPDLDFRATLDPTSRGENKIQN